MVEILRDRAKTLVEMADQSVYFFKEFDEYDEKAAQKNLTPDALPVLQALHAALDALGEWSAEQIHESVTGVSERLQVKLGKVAQPLRVAVTGGSVSPSIDQTLMLIGRERTLSRIQKAAEWIASKKV